MKFKIKKIKVKDLKKHIVIDNFNALIIFLILVGYGYMFYRGIGLAGIAFMSLFILPALLVQCSISSQINKLILEIRELKKEK